MQNKSRIIGFNLLFNSLGGSREQIKGILDNIDLYDYKKVIIFSSFQNKDFLDKNKYKKIRIIFISFISKNIFLRISFEQIILPFLCIFHKIDLLFCPGNISPIFFSKKKIQWIGTVGPFEKDFYKEISFFKRIKYLANKYFMIFSAKTSDYVIFESFYTKNLFIKNNYIQEKQSKIITIGNSKNHNFINNVVNSKNIFIACISHIYAYKNFEVLVKAVRLVLNDNYKFKVYIAGSIEDKKYYYKILKLINKYDLKRSIIFLGAVNKNKVLELYRDCLCIVNTSPIENFAYTLVEAMSCGTPIITTNTTAMPETCKNAALYFSPNDFNKLSSNIKQLIDSRATRKKLSDLSLERSLQIYDYRITNIKTLEVFNLAFKQ